MGMETHHPHPQFHPCQWRITSPGGNWLAGFLVAITSYHHEKLQAFAGYISIA
jgi:hypothetical protein